MNDKNDVTHLYTIPWEVPNVPQPQTDVIIHVSIAVAQAVLKKNTAIRIPGVLSNAEPIIIKPEALIDYHTFSNYVKSTAKSLDIRQNVIFFGDFEEEHRFLFDISCVWAIMFNRTEVNMVAVTLNTDLSGRLVTWNIISPVVINDLHPPEDPASKRQTIASLQAASSTKRKHRAIEIYNEEESMDFAGPIFKRNENDVVCKITVWKRYVPLLFALNSLIFTIDNQFLQINRTNPINEDIVREICKRVLEEHSINDDI